MFFNRYLTRFGQKMTWIGADNHADAAALGTIESARLGMKHLGTFHMSFRNVISPGLVA